MKPASLRPKKQCPSFLLSKHLKNRGKTRPRRRNGKKKKRLHPPLSLSFPPFPTQLLNSLNPTSSGPVRPLRTAHLSNPISSPTSLTLYIPNPTPHTSNLALPPHFPTSTNPPLSTTKKPPHGMALQPTHAPTSALARILISKLSIITRRKPAVLEPPTTHEIKKLSHCQSQLSISALFSFLFLLLRHTKSVLFPPLVPLIPYFLSLSSPPRYTRRLTDLSVCFWFLYQKGYLECALRFLGFGFIDDFDIKLIYLGDNGIAGAGTG